LERGVRPIGDWSMSMTLSSSSMPLSVLYGAGCSRAFISFFATALYSVSTTSVDLPPPDTPVTQLNVPSGTLIPTSLRLLPVAPVSSRNWFLWPLRRMRGTGMRFMRSGTAP